MCWSRRLHIGENERHHRSPRLLLVSEPTPEGTALGQGTYGPEMEVWSEFLDGYMITGLLGAFAGMLGFAQVTISTYPRGLWITGGMALIAVLLYIGAQLG